MSFKSKQQAKWMFANKPRMAKEWASKTSNIKKLPAKVGAGKKKKKKGFVAAAFHQARKKHFGL